MKLNITHENNARYDVLVGDNAEEIKGFEPTRGELKLLAADYIRLDLEFSYIWFLYRQTGSDWMRRQRYANSRIARIAELIGEETVNSIREEWFMKIIHPEDRDIFLNGTDEERNRVSDQAWAAINDDEFNAPSSAWDEDK